MTYDEMNSSMKQLRSIWKQVITYGMRVFSFGT